MYLLFFWATYVFCIVYTSPKSLTPTLLIDDITPSHPASLLHQSPLIIRTTVEQTNRSMCTKSGSVEANYTLYITADSPVNEAPFLTLIDIEPPEVVMMGMTGDTLPTLVPSKALFASLDTAFPTSVSFLVPVSVVLPTERCNRQIHLRCKIWDSVVDVLLPPPSGRLELHVLSVNDYHGRIGTSVCDSDEAVALNLAIQVESKRKEYGAENCIFVSIGDLVGASQYESAMEYDQPTLRIFETMNLTCSVIGNHELMNGCHYFLEKTMSSQITFLSANVVNEISMKPIVDPVMSLDFPLTNNETYRLSLVGLVTQDTEEYLESEAITGLLVLDPAETLTQILEDADQDLGDIILLAHIGIHHTPDVNTLDEYLMQDTEFSRVVRRASASVIAILNGHTHDVYSYTQKCPSEHCPAAPNADHASNESFARPIIQSGHHGEWLADITILVDIATKRVVEVTAVNLPVAGVSRQPEDSLYADSNPVVQRVANIVSASLQKQPIELVGNVVHSLSHDDRYGETPLCDLVADGLLEAAMTDGFWVDFAIQNSDAVRQSIAPSDGAVFTSDIYNTLPLQNQLVIVDLPGQLIPQVLEQQWLADGSRRRLCPAGLEYWYDSTAPIGSRVITDTILIRSEPLNPDLTYKVVVSDFLSEGGNHYEAMLGRTGIRYLHWIENETLRYYIGKHSPIDQWAVPRTLDQSAFLGGNVTFTFSVPQRNLDAGQEYNSDIVFSISTPFKPSVDMVLEDTVFFSFGCDEIVPNQTYKFQLALKQTYDGPPDSRIMAITQDLTSNPLGFGLLATPLYPMVVGNHDIRSLAMPSVTLALHITCLLHVLSLFSY